MIIFLALSVLAYFFVEFVWGSKRDEYIILSKPKGNFLIVDTETFTTVTEEDFKLERVENFPKIKQICWILVDPKGAELERKNYYTSFPTKTSSESGEFEVKKIHEIILQFSEALNRAHYLVAHNVAFDKNVIEGEAIRHNIQSGIKEVLTICTMKLATTHCKLKLNGKQKWPKLTELHEYLFNEKVEEKHEAHYDSQLCLKCFKALYNSRVIKMTDINSVSYNI